MSYIVFFSALLGGYFPARKNGLSRFSAFGFSVFIAMMLVVLMSFIGLA
jgi:hypothetical protein